MSLTSTSRGWYLTAWLLGRPAPAVEAMPGYDVEQAREAIMQSSRADVVARLCHGRNAPHVLRTVRTFGLARPRISFSSCL